MTSAEFQHSLYSHNTNTCPQDLWWSGTGVQSAYLCQLQGHGSAHDILTSADIYFLPPSPLSAMYGYSLCEEQGKDMVSPMTFLHQRTCTSSIITVSHMWINLLRRANYLPAIKARTWFHPWCSYISGHVLPSSITTVCHVWIQPLWGANYTCKPH